jgi:RHS repeat-associated protein
VGPTGIPLTTISSISTGTNRILDAGWSYDSNGNIIASPSAQPINYDAENRQVSYTPTGSSQTTYVYDGEGRRVQKIETSGTTSAYVYDAMGSLAAEYTTGAAAASGTQYLTADHLGSPRMMTGGPGSPSSQTVFHDYQPFGYEIPAGIDGRSASYGETDNPRQKFTGKERDSETGLDYFGARYFSAAQGRWTSPDPYNAILVQQGMEAGGLPSEAVASVFDDYLENPQNWNRYAYVRNSPLRLFDPTGEAPLDGHHLIPVRDGFRGVAQEFTNAVKTGELSGNGYPNQPGFNEMHRAYNDAVKEMLQEAEQTEGNANSWSVSQWKAFADQVLNSSDTAIRNFLDTLEKSNPGAKAALAASIRGFQVAWYRLAAQWLKVQAAAASAAASDVFIIIVVNPDLFCYNHGAGCATSRITYN